MPWQHPRFKFRSNTPTTVVSALLCDVERSTDISINGSSRVWITRLEAFRLIHVISLWLIIYSGFVLIIFDNITYDCNIVFDAGDALFIGWHYAMMSVNALNNEQWKRVMSEKQVIDIHIHTLWQSHVAHKPKKNLHAKSLFVRKN